MPKLIAANFKMNGSFSFIKKWFDAFIKEHTSSNEVIVALPAPYLSMRGNGNVKVSAQNVSANESGAYTSQISVSMITDNKVSYCIVGHSEAREYLNESNEDIKAKYDLLVENKVKPIVCIGESLKTRELNETFEFITKQLEYFKNIEDEITFAYEPIWAIGTGLVPSDDDIEQVVKHIRSHFSQSVKVLYGGSVKGENASNLLNNLDIDGVLVGGASLNPQEFAKIAQSC